MRLAVGARASVRVPATSANLGPGYDALGLALAWYDDVDVEVTAAGLRFDIGGQGADTAPRDESHLIISTLRAALTELGASAPGLHLSSVNRIPHGRGLGSSAAAICAGVLLAQALVADANPGRRADDDIFGVDWALATAGRIEGHPDNVAPCLLGGLTIAWTDVAVDGCAHARALGLTTVSQLRPVVFVPALSSSTEQARRLLPAVVPHVDAAFNAARAALLVAALTVNTAALLTATEDRLHQDYRASAMPESAALVARLRAAGLAAVISGAGPTVLVLATSEADVARSLAFGPPGWLARESGVAAAGARVSESSP